MLSPRSLRFSGRSDRAGAEEDGLGLLGDDTEVGDGELGAGAEDSAEGEGQLLVEEDRLAWHKREGAREVVLVEMGDGARCGSAEPSGFIFILLLKVAEPRLGADEEHVDPEQHSADQDEDEEEKMPSEDRFHLLDKFIFLVGVCSAGNYGVIFLRIRFFVIVEL